ncbi:MAG: FHA domain-containing protein [Chloroflexi bacterium]|nr:FHA domain-containing protein [Chloroflexota bacterium]
MESGFCIEILSAGHPPCLMALPPGALVVGRSPRSCRLVVPDPRVSRVHLLIRRDANRGITIIDLYSANGTLLAGRPLPPGIAFHWLIDQPVKIGGTALVLRYGLAGYPVAR